MYNAPYIFVKPYVEYTFPVIAPGFSPGNAVNPDMGAASDPQPNAAGRRNDTNPLKDHGTFAFDVDSAP